MSTSNLSGARDDSSSIFSSLSGSSQWKSGIYCVKYRKRGKITLITRIDVGRGDATLLRKELSLFLLLGRGRSNQDIDTVKVKRIPLDSGKVLSGTANKVSRAFYHAYVILKIGGQYVSLEKHSDSLTIQISDDVDDVSLKLRGKPRCGAPELIVKEEGNISLKRLTKFIVDSDFVHEGYSIIDGNHCKQFAERIFKKVALSSKYDWIEEQLQEIRNLQHYIAVPATNAIAEHPFLGPVAKIIVGDVNC